MMLALSQLFSTKMEEEEEKSRFLSSDLSLLVLGQFSTSELGLHVAWSQICFINMFNEPQPVRVDGFYTILADSTKHKGKKIKN